MTQKSKLEQTYIKYRGHLAKIISGIVKRDDVEDLVQETFVKSYEAELKQEIRYERTYMIKTARNLALNHVAKYAEKNSSSLSELDEIPKDLLSVSLEKQVESKERFLDFCRATDTLSPEVKRVFLLKKVYGLSQRDISLQLELSESTVEKHVAKGLLLCADYLSEIAKADEGKVKNKKNLLGLSRFEWVKSKRKSQ